jgi:hypothetical protein
MLDTSGFAPLRQTTFAVLWVQRYWATPAASCALQAFGHQYRKTALELFRNSPRNRRADRDMGFIVEVDDVPFNARRYLDVADEA